MTWVPQRLDQQDGIRGRSATDHAMPHTARWAAPVHPDWNVKHAGLYITDYTKHTVMPASPKASFGLQEHCHYCCQHR
jgi:hypothetical protein